MKNLKLFTKIFLYTFLVMLFVTVMAHVFLYVLAPQMTVSTNRFVEGAIIESAVNTGILIKSAIGKALPVSLLCCAIISAGCSLLFSRAMTRPIKQIAETTEKMEKLDKAAICVVHTKDEIGELAARVNKLYMVKRYNDIYRVQMPNITPHVCRHTYCSNMAKSGMNPKTLQYLMGHSDIGVTLNTYTHLGLEDAVDELKRVEELENARKEMEKINGEGTVSQKMFRAI